MSTKHTPGPWLIAGTTATKTNVEIHIESKHRAVADVYWANGFGSYPNQAEAEANARVIAAAPELLLALKDTVATLMALSEKYHDGLENLVGTTVFNARAVIAKAGGAA